MPYDNLKRLRNVGISIHIHNDGRIEIDGVPFDFMSMIDNAAMCAGGECQESKEQLANRYFIAAMIAHALYASIHSEEITSDRVLM